MHSQDSSRRQMPGFGDVISKCECWLRARHHPRIWGEYRYCGCSVNIDFFTLSISVAWLPGQLGLLKIRLNNSHLKPHSSEQSFSRPTGSKAGLGVWWCKEEQPGSPLQSRLEPRGALGSTLHSSNPIKTPAPFTDEKNRLPDVTYPRQHNKKRSHR